MAISTTIVAVIVNMLTSVFVWLGIEIGEVELTTTVNVIVSVATGLWIWYQRTTLKKAPHGQGDVNAAGLKTP